MPTSRRILCVWLPYWATTRWRNARVKAGAPADEALATVVAERGMRRLAAICPRVEAAGLHAGQPLTQALAICPALIVAEAEPGEDAKALAALAHWATRYTPLAAAAPPDTLWLDCAGCDHLFGGEAALAGDLARRLAHWGLVARWAIADTPGAAHALARHAPGRTIATGAQAEALAPLPIAALRLDPGDVAGLRRLGIKTIAALGRLPRGELVARFGPGARLRLDQALGDVAEPIAWPPPPPDWTETERFAEPILTTEACMAVLDRLGGRLCTRLAAQALGARQCVAAFTRLDGSGQNLAIVLAAPVHDPAWLLRLLAERLADLDPGHGIETVSLAAPAIEATPARQAGLAGDGGGQIQQRLARLVDTLSNRLRPDRIWRLAPCDSHIPERAEQPAPVLTAGKVLAWPASPGPRPIRLFRTPEPIEVIALLPDDPPVRFRWRGALHRVRAATGPERIEAEWWHAGTEAARDYYQVEDEAGARYWMFRAATAWFLHGLFG